MAKKVEVLGGLHHRGANEDGQGDSQGTQGIKTHHLVLPLNFNLPASVHVWGIDPCTKDIGMAVLRPGMPSVPDGGGYTTSVTFTLWPNDRLAHWWQRNLSMCQLLQKVATLLTSPTFTGRLVIGMEIPGVYRKQGSTSMKLGEIRGMIMLLLSRHYAELGKRFTLYPTITPAAAKNCLACNGLASKGQMVEAARHWWIDGVGCEGEADALGIALAAWEKFTGRDWQCCMKNT